MGFLNAKCLIWGSAAVINLVLAIVATVSIHRSYALSLPLPVAAFALSLLVSLIPFVGFTIAALATCTRLSKVNVSRSVLYNVYYALSLLDSALISIAGAFLQSLPLDCSIESTWRENFHNKNTQAIRGVEEILQCCGLRSIKDQAWPFPNKNRGVDACIVAYPERNKSCFSSLRHEASRVLGGLLAIGIASLLLKVVLRLLEGQSSASSSRTWSSHVQNSIQNGAVFGSERPYSDDTNNDDAPNGTNGEQRRQIEYP